VRRQALDFDEGIFGDIAAHRGLMLYINAIDVDNRKVHFEIVA